MANKPDSCAVPVEPADGATPTPAARRHGRGRLQLVLLASAGAVLPGCGPSVDDQPVALQRAEYASVEDCLKDWRDEAECEPRRTGGSLGGSGYAGGGGGASPGRLGWWGPYYTQSGQVYRYNGRVETAHVDVRHATQVQHSALSPNQIYNASGSGRYASVAPAPGAAPAKTSAVGRGGFGSTGRGGSGGG